MRPEHATDDFYGEARMKSCTICGILPRMFWLFGQTKFWHCLDRMPDRLCPSCYYWARNILARLR